MKKQPKNRIFIHKGEKIEFKPLDSKIAIEIRELLAGSKIGDAIKLFSQSIDQRLSVRRDELLMIESNLRTIEIAKIKGTISDEYYLIEINRIIERILALISMLDTE